MIEITRRILHFYLILSISFLIPLSLCLLFKANKTKQSACYESPRAAGTNYHKLCCLKNRHLFSPSSGGWKSKIKVLAGPGYLFFWWWPSSLAFLGSQLHHSSLCLCHPMATCPLMSVFTWLSLASLLLFFFFFFG